MSYIGVTPVPKASLILTQGTFGTGTQIITVPGGYQPGNIFVYINGLRLQSSEYTATDGNDIDLGESFPSGTDYIVEEIRSFTIPNHYTKAEIGSSDASSGSSLVGYDNTASGLTATEAQAAIDESLDNQLGWSQTWQDVTASRSTGVTYTNSTGRPIYLMIRLGTGSTSTLSIDGFDLSRSAIDQGGNVTHTAIIPDGSDYSMTSSGIASWWELR